MKYLKMLLLVTLLVTAVPVAAQQIERPIHEVGEWCEFQNQDGGISRHMVTDAKPDGSFVVHVTSSDFFGTAERVYDANQWIKKTPDGEYSPARLGPRFPLKVGKPYGGGKFTYLQSRRATLVEANTVVTSIRSERVNVPAGTFDSIRVDMQVHYKYDNGYENYLEETKWYALDPKIKRFLKFTAQDYGFPDLSGDRLEFSLVRCGKEGVTTIFAETK